MLNDQATLVQNVGNAQSPDRHVQTESIYVEDGNIEAKDSLFTADDKTEAQQNYAFGHIVCHIGNGAHVHDAVQ